VAALKITIRRCRLAGGASQASQPSRPWLGRFLFGYPWRLRVSTAILELIKSKTNAC
jgi:hypothetical protein